MVVTTWDFVRMKEEKPRRQKRKEPPASCCVWGRRTGGNDGRRYYVASSGSEYSELRWLALQSGEINQHGYLELLHDSEQKSLMLPYPEVSVRH